MKNIQNAYEKIAGIVGSKYVTDSKPVCYAYSMNCDTVLQGIPDLVVRPGSTQEVAEILKVANHCHFPVVPRGGGADLTGGAKPIGDGGLVLDITRMNKVLDVDEKNHVVTVEAGISWSELCDQLRRVGVGYYTGSTGPGSGFSATIGGGLSNNSVGGGGAAMYGNVTEQCVGLEVVLPTGEIIYTGSKANSFCEPPFTRFGLGPDYSGIFLGDVGMHGVKTKASLRLYPLPEYAAYATFEIRGDDKVPEPIKATNVMVRWQQQRLPLHDFYYYTEQYMRVLRMFEVKKSLIQAGVEGSVVFYTTVARSSVELDANVAQVNKTAQDGGWKKLGDTIEEGNLGKWFYEEDGRWQWAHIYWGLLGPGSVSMGTCLKCPTYKLPDYVKMYDDWNVRNTRKIGELGVGAANFIAFGVHPSYVDVTGGFMTHTNKEKRGLQYELWKDLLMAQMKDLGAVHYWMGDIIGRALVDVGALTPEYYNFMVTLKKALDPNKILSLGKFYLDERY